MEYCANGSLYHVLSSTSINFGWDLFFSMAIGTINGIIRLHQNEPQILHRYPFALMKLILQGLKDVEFAGNCHLSN